jgi:hypothetical protein
VLPDEIAIAPALSAAAIQTIIADQIVSSGALLPGIIYQFEFGECNSSLVAQVDADGSVYINGSPSPTTPESPDVYYVVTANGTDSGTYTVSGIRATFKIGADAINRSCSGDIWTAYSLFTFPVDNACGLLEISPFSLLEDKSAFLGGPAGEKYPLIRESLSVYTRLLENGRKERYSLLKGKSVRYALEDGTSGAVICSVDGTVN